MDVTVTIDRLIKKYGTSNPFRLCDFLDIIVVRQPLHPETRGVYKYFRRNKIICINSTLNELEQLKACAHELGHALIHTKINSMFLQHATYLKTSQYEREADLFAQLLLEQLMHENDMAGFY